MVDKSPLKKMQEIRFELAKTNAADDLGIGLGFLRMVQKRVSSPVPGCIPPGNELPTKDTVRAYCLAFMIETAEFIQTLDWKPWKNKAKPCDTERALDEFADIMAFLGIIVEHLYRMGITPGDLAEAYRKKSIINVDRFLGEHGSEYHQETLK